MHMTSYPVHKHVYTNTHRIICMYSHFTICNAYNVRKCTSVHDSYINS